MKKLVRETIARNREVLGTGSDQKWDALMSEGSEP
jgi:hypothetical protein